MQESSVQREVWFGVTDTTVLFRVNTGKGWVSGGGKVQRLTNGSVVVPFARPVALGLALASGKPVGGTHDLLGYTPITITPEMVGKTLPVFTAIEVKHSEGGRESDAQDHFASNICKAGGIAGYARSKEDARRLIFDYRKALLKYE